MGHLMRNSQLIRLLRTLIFEHLVTKQHSERGLAVKLEQGKHTHECSRLI